MMNIRKKSNLVSLHVSDNGRNVNLFYAERELKGGSIDLRCLKPGIRCCLGLHCLIIFKCLGVICVLSWRNLSTLMWLIVPEIFRHLCVVSLCLFIEHNPIAFPINVFNGFNISIFFYDTQVFLVHQQSSLNILL